MYRQHYLLGTTPALCIQDSDCLRSAPMNFSLPFFAQLYRFPLSFGFAAFHSEKRVKDWMSNSTHHLTICVALAISPINSFSVPSWDIAIYSLKSWALGLSLSLFSLQIRLSLEWRRSRSEKVVGMGSRGRGNRPEWELFWMRNNCIRSERATMRTRGLTPWWRNSW
jgi:hypothetical protein